MKPAAKRIYLAALALFTAVYLVWRVGWTMPLDHGVRDMIFAVILLITELLGAAEMAVHFWMEGSREACPAVPEWDPKDLPDVDVLVPTCGEPVPLVERTLRGCLAMEYEGAGKVHIYLCDDAASDEMRALTDSLGINYLARPEHQDAKAGNLNFALQHCSSPLVAVFDADMCPEPGFLLNTVPFFLTRPGKYGLRNLSQHIGFVQTPQNFRNADLFQRAFRAEQDIPNEQDYFYLELEPARNRHNAVIFGGSNTLLSRKALDSAGGFVTGTLTEDFATGIEIQKKGYRAIAIDTPLATGLAPESLTALIRQRIRWARGCIQAGRRTRLMTAKGLTAAQRLSYLTAITYWYAPVKRLVYLFAPLMFSVFGVTVMRCDFQQMLLFWLPMYLMASFGIRLFSGDIRSARWSHIYELCLFPFLLPGVLAETAGIRKRDFAVTDKSGRGSWRWWYPLPFLVLIALSILGVARTVSRIISEQTSIYLLLLFWLLFNLYELLFALLFTLSCRALPPSPEENARPHHLSVSSGWRTSFLYIVYRIIHFHPEKGGTRK